MGLAAALAVGLALTSIAVAYLARWRPIADQGDISTAALHRLKFMREISPVGFSGLSPSGRSFHRIPEYLNKLRPRNRMAYR